ncbi:hypothetical protein [Devosia marina]|uniref:Uncharacterized protein n=1 Tax=Devosia marina TaxID=2683198 RepID=A0A7X3K2G8_9HYPH|nr:hypothetical protein [Devosia marina]MVS97898.1 hypothetical protein [Devosia marina]
MPVIDRGDHYHVFGQSTDLWAVGDALYFPNGVTEEWQMRPALDTDLPHPHLQHRPGAMKLVRRWPNGIMYYQLIVVPPTRRKLSASNCAWAVKRELRRNADFRRIVTELDAGRTPDFAA